MCHKHLRNKQDAKRADDVCKMEVVCDSQGKQTYYRLGEVIPVGKQIFVSLKCEKLDCSFWCLCQHWW